MAERRRPDDFKDEIESHIRLEADRYRERGMSEEDALAAARKTFGNVTKAQERFYECGRRLWWDTFRQDLKVSVRSLAKTPGWMLVAVLTIALGIGATTAIFSIIDALLLRSLPVAHPEQLVMLTKTFTDDYIYTFPYQDTATFASLDAFSGLTAVTPVDRSGFVIGGSGDLPDASQTRIGVVLGNYFAVLGVKAQIGRTFTMDEDFGEGAHPVAVISNEYWQLKLGSASDAVGRTLVLNGVTYTIIGVTPPEFFGDWVGRPFDMWIPIAMVHQLMPELVDNRRGANLAYRLIARVRPEVPRSMAESAAHARLTQIVSGPGASPGGRLRLEPAARGFSPQREFFTQPLEILMAMVAALLLAACANIANLLLARSTARRQEIVVRLAIGAGRARIVRQLLAESFLLAIMGGGLGAVFATWGANLLATLVRSGPVGGITGMSSIDLDIHPDARIFAFTATMSLLTGALFGLLPAWRGSQVSLAGALGRRGADLNATGGRFNMRNLLVASQVAVSLVLLAATGLFVRSLHNLRSENLGIEREHLLLVWTLPGQTGRTGAALAALYDEVLSAIAGLPGVVSAAPTSYGVLEFNPGNDGPTMTADGYFAKRGEGPRAQFHIVGPGFFDTIGMRLLEGRDFNARDDAGAAKVTIINESMARLFFPGVSAVGRHVQVNFGNNPPLEVVGVVSDSKTNSPRDQDRRHFYYPVRQQVGLRLVRLCMVVRTSVPPLSVANNIRQELLKVVPRLPVLKIDTVDEQLDDVLFQERLIADLSVFFGAVAVGLACLGLYSVVSYSVTRRTNEIGIRMALGASRNVVVSMILGESLVLTLAGLALGVPAAIAAARLVKDRLWGVSAVDPLVFSGAILVVVAVTLVAGTIPARRASKLDPLLALREE